MTSRVVDTESFKAENDLSAKQYYLVEISAANQVDVCDGSTDIAIGVLLNEPTAGHAAQVGILGRFPVVSDGTTAIAAGDNVGTDGSGKAVKKTTNNDWVIGRAMAASSADGTIIDVLLTGGYYLGA